MSPALGSMNLCGSAATSAFTFLLREREPHQRVVAAERQVHDPPDAELHPIANDHLVRTLECRCKVTHVIDRDPCRRARRPASVPPSNHVRFERWLARDRGRIPAERVEIRASPFVGAVDNHPAGVPRKEQHHAQVCSTDLRRRADDRAQTQRLWGKIMAEYIALRRGRRRRRRRSAAARRSSRPSTATTIHVSGGAKGGDVVTTDGPFAETKEALGGFYLLDCKDLDEALQLGGADPRRLARPGRGSTRHRLQRAELIDSLDEIIRIEGGQVLATLIRLTGDIDRAEDALQDAVVVGRRGLAPRRRARQAGRVADDRRPQQGPRSVAA